MVAEDDDDRAISEEAMRVGIQDNMEEDIYEDNEELEEAILEYIEPSFSKDRKDKLDGVVNVVMKAELEKMNDIVMVDLNE